MLGLPRNRLQHRTHRIGFLRSLLVVDSDLKRLQILWKLSFGYSKGRDAGDTSFWIYFQT